MFDLNPTGIARITGAQTQLDSELRQYAERRAKILTAPRLAVGEEGFAHNTERARQEVRAELAKAQAATLDAINGRLTKQVEDGYATAKKEIAARMGGGEPSDPTKALLRETKLNRAWDRIKPRFDRIEDDLTALREMGTVARDAALAGDTDTLDALFREVRPYCVGRGAEEAYTEQACREVEKALAQVRPDLAGALEARQELERVVYAARLSLSYAREALQSNEGSVVLVNADKSVRTIPLGTPENIPAVSRAALGF